MLKASQCLILGTSKPTHEALLLKLRKQLCQMVVGINCSSVEYSEHRNERVRASYLTSILQRQEINIYIFLRPHWVYLCISLVVGSREMLKCVQAVYKAAACSQPLAEAHNTPRKPRTASDHSRGSAPIAAIKLLINLFLNATVRRLEYVIFHPSPSMETVT